MSLKHESTQIQAHVSTLNIDTHTHRAISHPSTLSIFNRSSAYREIRYILSVRLETAGSEIYCAGEHISLNPVSKVDGILAKIFIYNILQQRLDRLLLAVLRRKRGRSVHEWDCRLG